MVEVVKRVVPPAINALKPTAFPGQEEKDLQQLDHSIVKREENGLNFLFSPQFPQTYFLFFLPSHSLQNNFSKIIQNLGFLFDRFLRQYFIVLKQLPKNHVLHHSPVSSDFNEVNSLPVLSVFRYLTREDRKRIRFIKIGRYREMMEDMVLRQLFQNDKILMEETIKEETEILDYFRKVILERMGWKKEQKVGLRKLRDELEIQPIFLSFYDGMIKSLAEKKICSRLKF
jgi:hypothetical protein